MAVLGGAALLEAEINAGIEVFKLLEPEVQKGFIALFHYLHRAKAAAAPTVEVPASELPSGAKAPQDLSSTSLDPETPSTS
jgi:hypothetical protein